MFVPVLTRRHNACLSPCPCLSCPKYHYATKRSRKRPPKTGKRRVLPVRLSVFSFLPFKMFLFVARAKEVFTPCTKIKPSHAIKGMQHAILAHKMYTCRHTLPYIQRRATKKKQCAVASAQQSHGAGRTPWCNGGRRE